ncbi:unnamed protein product [Rotaria sordida]|uniref:Uncharacterized protein n=1 Tax=Rotaria sordida TaxID=392033 RepID=A0A815DUL3_9BILA|nr:unnamed protein product [Rotaria sordida]
MKKLVIIFTVISLLLIYIVDTDIPRDINEKYIRSYNQWQHVKKLWNNSYQYTSGRSSWTGYRSSTTIFVLNGEVVGREFSAFDRGQLRKHWFENKDQLYSHGQTSGEIQLGTLDNIYSACLQSLNVSNPNSRQKYDLTFEVDTANHGLLKSCGHYPIGCADDCFFGVSIDNLKSYQQHQPKLRCATSSYAGSEHEVCRSTEVVIALSSGSCCCIEPIEFLSDVSSIEVCVPRCRKL